MDKKLKSLISKLKLSDEDLLKLILSKSEDGSDDSDDPKDQSQAEEGAAGEEQPKKNLSISDLKKIIQEAVKGEKEELKPSQKKILKAEPKIIPKDEKLKIGNFQLVE